MDSGSAFTGTSGNDTFNATASGTFNALDTLDGGDGIDTLNVADNVLAVATAGRVVKNIEIANLSSALGVVADTTGWTGLTNLNVVSSAAGAQTTNAAVTTGVAISNSTGQAIVLVGGGNDVSVATAAAGNITIGDTANGAANANQITSASTTGGAIIAITDNSGAAGVQGTKLTTVSINNAADDQTITANGVTTLNLTKLVGADTVGDTTIVSAVGARALTVTYDGVDVAGDGAATAGTLTMTDAEATSLNIKASGSKSYDVTTVTAEATAVTIDAAVALQMDALTAGVAKTVALSGAEAVTVAEHTLAADAVITSTNTKGVTFTGDILAGQTFNGGAGNDSIKLAATGTKAITMGAGDDTVTATAALGTGGSVNGGDGNDTLVVNAAAFALTGFTGFETLGLGASATGAYTATGFTALTQGAVTGPVAYNNVAAGAGLTVTATVGQTTAYNLANITGDADVLNLTVKSAGVVDTGAITANGVEIINVTSTDTDTTQHQNTVNLASNALEAITITGNAGVALVAADTTITSVDASTLSLTGTVAAGNGFTWTAGVVVDNLVVKGSATGGDNIDVSAAAVAGKTVAVTTYAGTNTVTGSALVDTITGGTGADTILAGAGNDVIVGGGGADIITGGAGADKITVSGNTWTIKQAAIGDSGANTSTTIQTAQLTSTFDVVFGATAGGKIDLGNADIAGADLILAGANLAAGADGTAVFARGTYDAAAGTFTYAANGADSALTYDSTVGAGLTAETIILVGYVAADTTAAVGGVITLG